MQQRTLILLAVIILSVIVLVFLFFVIGGGLKGGREVVFIAVDSEYAYVLMSDSSLWLGNLITKKLYKYFDDVQKVELSKQLGAVLLKNSTLIYWSQYKKYEKFFENEIKDFSLAGPTICKLQLNGTFSCKSMYTSKCDNVSLYFPDAKRILTVNELETYKPSIVLIKEDDSVWYYKYTCEDQPSVILETKVENIYGNDIKKVVDSSCFLTKNNTLLCMSIDKLGKINVRIEDSNVRDISGTFPYRCIVKIDGTVLCKGSLYYPNEKGIVTFYVLDSYTDVTPKLLGRVKMIAIEPDGNEGCFVLQNNDIYCYDCCGGEKLLPMQFS